MTGQKPWCVVAGDGGKIAGEFETASQALQFVEKSADVLDPEEQSRLWLEYTEPEDWAANMDDYALVGNRIICRIVGGWAGGWATYQLQVVGQWAQSSTYENTNPGSPPLKFWLGEGDVIVFSKDDL